MSGTFFLQKSICHPKNPRLYFRLLSLDNLLEKLDAVQLKHHLKKIEVWFADEARFGQQGTITRVWALCGSRPRVLRQTKYEWLSTTV